MRVTKIIREYVEKTITSKLPYGKPTAEFKTARETLDNLRDKLEKEVRAYAEQRIASVTSDLPEGFKLSLVVPASSTPATLMRRCLSRLTSMNMLFARSVKLQSSPFWWNWNWNWARPRQTWND